ncbi:MAG: Gfo/Idh/MocA family oxidoreductase [Balneolales bacterium]
MKNNRREFIKRTGLAGAGIFVGGSRNPEIREPFPQTQRQRFNMSGYAAPKLETVRVGIIGIGSRGSSMVRAFTRIEGVEVKAICDLEPDRVSEAIESISDRPGHNPETYSGTEDAWKQLCEQNDIDLVYICTPWHLHTRMAVYAMEHEKHAASERPIAVTMDECWQLVETSERTRQHCINMTQSSHHGMSAVALNMVRDGYFGEVIHGEGCYIHELNNDYYLFSKTQFHNMWRLKENTRNGNLYPDSGSDTVSQIMDINCGDKMDYLVSVSSDDFSMGKKVKELAETDPFFEPYARKNYGGNINITVIRTVRGRTIMLQHDVSSPRPRPQNLDLVSGSEGIFMYHNQSPAIATSHRGWVVEDEFQELVDEYTPEMMKRFDELSRQQPGPSARIRPMDWRLIDCLRNGLPLEMSVYDSVLYSSLGPLTEWSVANRSHPVQVPDFTAGSWQTNKRGMDVELQNGGGTTRLI